MPEAAVEKMKNSQVSGADLVRRLEFDREDVFALLSNRKVKKDLWHWQYEKNPSIPLVEKNSVALYKANELVGFCGIMPVKVKFDDQHYMGKWCVDLHVSPQFRRQGIAGELYRIIETESDVAMGFATSDAAYSLKLSRGWESGDEAEEFFFNNQSINLKGFIKRVLQLGLKGVGFFSGVKPETDANSNLDVDNKIELQDFDLLWSEVEDGYKRTVVRDANYLNWKYIQHPAGNYSIMSLRDNANKLRGALVLRKSADIARIVDYIGPAKDMQCKLALLNQFLQWSRGSAQLQCITSCTEWKRLLKQAGFLRYSKKRRFTVYINRDHKPENASGWFLMTGDSDSDLMSAIVSDL